MNDYCYIHTNNVSLVEHNNGIIKIINCGDQSKSINACFPTVMTGNMFCTNFTNINKSEEENNYALDFFNLNNEIVKSSGNNYKFLFRTSIEDIESNYNEKNFKISKMFIYDYNKNNMLTTVVENNWNS